MAQNRDAIHILRGSREKIGGIIPAAGQPLYDRTNNILYIGDGKISIEGVSSPDGLLKLEAITVDDLAITTPKIRDEAVTLAKVNTTDTSDGLSSKFVNKDTEQVISGSKHFNKDITVGNSDGTGSYTTGYSTILAKEYLTFGSGGKTATITSGIAGSSPSSRVFTLPQKSGVFALTGDIPTNYVTTNTEQYIVTTKTFASNPASFPKTTVNASGMTIYPSQSIGTYYSDSAITRVNGSTPSVIKLPSKAGTIALISDTVNMSGDQSEIAGNKSFTGNLSTTGNITADSGITAKVFYATSDKRLKENIVDYKPEKSILDIPVKEYNFIGDDKKHIGFIAQDLQEVFPELVVEKTDGYLSIEESKLIYLLIDEVKKLKEKIGE